MDKVFIFGIVFGWYHSRLFITWLPQRHQALYLPVSLSIFQFPVSVHIRVPCLTNLALTSTFVI